MDQSDTLHLVALCVTIASVFIFSEKKTATQISGLAFCAIAISLHFSSRDVPPAGIIIFILYYVFGWLLARILFWAKTFILSKIKVTTNKATPIAVLRGLGFAILFMMLISLLVGLFFPAIGFIASDKEKNTGNVFGILVIVLSLIIGTFEEIRFYRKIRKNREKLTLL
jgi:membrane protease YdiL (CAAX protease family)